MRSGRADPDVGRPGRSGGARAAVAVAVVAAAMGLLLFVPAGTAHYWQAWLYLSIFTAASAFTTLYVIRYQPALLERRMRGGPMAETRPAQKLIMLFTSAGFVALLIVPALDRRFGWSRVPPAVVLAGDVLVIIGFALIVLVYRENPWTAATIELAEDQRVVSTGPYAVVRHPMYASAFLYLLGTPLALGSCWGLIPVATIVPFLLWRLFDEERFLSEKLPGYTDYRRRVRRRLVPLVW